MLADLSSHQPINPGGTGAPPVGNVILITLKSPGIHRSKLEMKADKTHNDPMETLPLELEKFWRTDDGLTACERAEAYGIDLSLLDESLRLSPAERFEHNLAALEFATSLQVSALHAEP